MRVGLYNRWLATLGGGEKHSLAIAEYVSKRYPVTVISHEPVSKEAAAERLNLDLSRVTFTTIADRSPLDMTPVTGEYDLFFNTSYMDFFPSVAKHSASLIYFPAKLNFNLAVRRSIKRYLRELFCLPAMRFGSRTFNITNARFTWLLDPLATVQLPASARPYQTSFELCALDPAVRTVTLRLNGQEHQRLRLPASGEAVRCEMLIPGSAKANRPEVSIVVEDDVAVDGKPKVQLSNVYLDLPQFRFFRSVFEERYRGWGWKMQFYPPAFAILDYFATYDVVWANSEFTRQWIRRYWRRDSEILYPRVDVESFRVGEKKQQILSVGRFFAGQHNKKHLEMVKAFKTMHQQGLRGWELHLAGGRGSRPEDAEYLQAIQDEAAGYPVVLHISAPYAELVNLYAESAIYWHAGGLGENEKREPEKFEHFGITTVEAMAAGCVPVVIGKGGQPEIVEHGKTGYLWNTLSELQSMTLHVMKNEALRKEISARAVESSKRFDRTHFEANIEAFLQKIGM